MAIKLNGLDLTEEREMIPVLNPATGAVIDSIPNMTERDIDAAVAATENMHFVNGPDVLN